MLRTITAVQRALEETLDTATQSRRMALVVASSYYRRMSKTLLDRMMRLQVLEGYARSIGAETASGAWSNNPARGIALASEWYDNAWHEGRLPSPIHPDWLDPSDTKLYTRLRAITVRVLGKMRESAVMADDIMQNMLMGLGADGTPRKKPFYEAGLKGNIIFHAPHAAEGPLGMFVYRTTITEASRIRRHRKIVEEHGGAVSDGDLDEEGGNTLWNTPDKLRIVADIFVDPHDPLGKKMRDLLRKSLQGGRNFERIDAWMKFIERKKRVPSPKDKIHIAEQLGISVQALDRYIRQTMEVFVPKLLGDHRIQTSLGMRYLNHGTRRQAGTTSVVSASQWSPRLDLRTKTPSP